jgi:hypothetical protein
VQSAAGETRAAEDWVPADERAKVPAVVVGRAPKVKEAWCLATTLSTRKASEVVKLCGKRFSIEETFRDQRAARSACSSKQPSPTVQQASARPVEPGRALLPAFPHQRR